MISYKLTDNGMEITGSMKTGDRINGLCCDGHDWVCDEIIMSAWGHCENPDCQAGVDGDDDMYRGLSNWYDEDIACFMADRDEASGMGVNCPTCGVEITTANAGGYRTYCEKCVDEVTG